MPANARVNYAVHPGANIEAGAKDVRNFVKTAMNDGWTPTVVNPAKEGGMTNMALFYLHIGVWVMSLILGSISNFGASSFLKKGDWSNDTSYNATTDNVYYTSDPTDTTVTIGILGGVFSILGVVALLGGAAWFNADEFREQVWLNVIIQFLTLYGTTATLYIFTEAASKTGNGAFWLGMFAVFFQVYAQVLLYCTSATLDVMALPRAFIPSLTASVQFISALAISSGDFAPTATDGQKTIAWFVPFLTLGSVAIMVLIRRYTRNGEGVSELGEFPFLRSLVLMPFFVSGLLSVYKLSFVKNDSSNPTSYMFAFLGMLLNFTIISVVFVPGSVSSNALDQK